MEGKEQKNKQNHLSPSTIHHPMLNSSIKSKNDQLGFILYIDNIIFCKFSN